MDTSDRNSFAAQFIHPVYSLLLHFCHHCISSSLCLYFTDFNNMPIEQSRVEFYFILCLKVWRHNIIENRGRKSMLWSLTVHYRLIKARGKGLSPAQSFMQFDCKHTCKQTSLRVFRVEGHIVSLARQDSNFSWSLGVTRYWWHCGHTNETFNVPCAAVMWNGMTFVRSFSPGWQLHFRFFSPRIYIMVNHRYQCTDSLWRNLCLLE